MFGQIVSMRNDKWEVHICLASYISTFNSNMLQECVKNDAAASVHQLVHKSLHSPLPSLFSSFKARFLVVIYHAMLHWLKWIRETKCKIQFHHHQSLNCEGRWGTTDDFVIQFAWCESLCLWFAFHIWLSKVLTFSFNWQYGSVKLNNSNNSKRPAVLKRSSMRNFS